MGLPLASETPGRNWLCKMNVWPRISNLVAGKSDLGIAVTPLKVTVLPFFSLRPLHILA